jgi:hypothetical protein
MTCTFIAEALRNYPGKRNVPQRADIKFVAREIKTAPEDVTGIKWSPIS